MTTLQTLTAEDLLAGASLEHVLEVPGALLDSNGKSNAGGIVRLRPLSIGLFQIILKAAREDPGLTPLLMVKECLVEPKLNLPQVRELPVGLVEHLVAQIRVISGLTEKKTL